MNGERLKGEGSSGARSYLPTHDQATPDRGRYVFCGENRDSAGLGTHSNTYLVLLYLCGLHVREWSSYLRGDV